VLFFTDVYRLLGSKTK